MKRLNLKFAVILLVGLAVLVGTVFGVHHFQVTRKAGNYKEEGRKYLSEGNYEKAQEALQQYISRVNDDTDVLKDLHKLAKNFFETQPDPRTYDNYLKSLDALILQDPDDVEYLREHINALFQNISRDNISLIEQRIAKLRLMGKIDNSMEFKDGFVQAAKGNNEQAIRVFARIIGFNTETEKFDPSVSEKCTTYEAYGWLANLYSQNVSTRKLAERVLLELEDKHKKVGEACLIAYAGWMHPQINNATNARRNLALAKQLAPDDRKTVAYSFQAAINDKEYDEAEKWANKFIEKSSRSPDGYLSLAQVMEAKQKPRAELMTIIDNGLKSVPQALQLELLKKKFQYVMSAVEIDADQARTILNDLKQYRTLNADSAQLLEAQLLVRESKWTAAQGILLQAIKTLTAPLEIAQANHLMGMCHEALGEYDLAANLYRKILTKDQRNLAIRLRLAHVLLQTNKIDESRNEYEFLANNMDIKRLIRVPELWQSLLQVRILKELGLPNDKRNWTKVDQLVTELKTLPDDVLPGLDKVLVEADVISRKGQHQEALNLIEPLREIDPTNIRTWSKWCEIASRFKKPAQVIAELEKAPEVVRNDQYMLLILGNQMAIQGGAEGKAGLLKLLEQGKTAPVAEQLRLNMLVADALARMEEYETAQTVATRALELSTTTKSRELLAYPILIRIAKDRNDITRLEQIQTELKRMNLPDPTIYRYARCQLLLSQIRKAQLERQKATDTYIVLNDAEKKILAEARELNQQLTEARPDWVEVFKLRADIAGFENKIPQVIAALSAAIERGGLERYRLRQLAQLYYQVGAYRNARTMMDQLFRDGDASLFRLNFQLMIQENRKAEAAQLLAEFTLSPQAPPSEVLWQAQALRQLDQLETAEPLLYSIINQDSEVKTPEAWLVLIDLLLRQKKNSAANEVLAKISQLPASENQMLTTARCAEQLGNQDLAMKIFPLAVEKFPDSLLCRRELAGFYMRNKLDQMAVKALDGVIEYARRHPNDPLGEEFSKWALRAKVITDTSTGQRTYQEFLAYDKELKDAVEANPTEINDLVLRINLLQNRSEPESLRKAISLFLDLQKRQELQVDDKILLAQLYQRTGNWPETKKIMEALSFSGKSQPRYRLIFSELLYLNEDYSEAEQYALTYAKETKDEDSIQYLLGCIYLKQNRIQEGLNTLSKYVGKFPVPAENLGRLQRVAMQVEAMKQISVAEKLYAELGKNGAVGKILNAKFIGRHKDVNEALKMLGEVITETPEQSFAAIATGIDLVQLRTNELKPEQREQAWQLLDRWYTKLQADSPNDERLPSLLANIRTIQGRPLESIKLYQQALASVADHRSQSAGTMCNNLAYSIAMQGNPDMFEEAFTSINKAIDIMGPQSDLLDTRGLLNLLKGEFLAAKSDFADAVLQPSAIKFYRLAYVNFKLNNDDEARIAYRKAKALGFDHRDLIPREQVLFQEFKTKFDPKAVASGS